MAMLSGFEARNFTPAQLRVLQDVFEETWQSVAECPDLQSLARVKEEGRVILARTIAELAAEGECDPKRLAINSLIRLRVRAALKSGPH